MPALAMIVAIGKNGVIGKAGGLPWNYPDDREHFRKTTQGHAVIMGRRTFEETGQPLPDRHNIVVSRTREFPPGVRPPTSLEAALEIAWSLDPIPFVIGGATLFEAAMPRITRAFITEIPEAPDGDTFFAFDPTGFRKVSERLGEMGERYLEYERGASGPLFAVS